MARLKFSQRLNKLDKKLANPPSDFSQDSLVDKSRDTVLRKATRSRKIDRLAKRIADSVRTQTLRQARLGLQQYRPSATLIISNCSDILRVSPRQAAIAIWESANKSTKEKIYPKLKPWLD